MRKLSDYNPVKHYGELHMPVAVCQSCWIKPGVVRPYPGLPVIKAEKCYTCGAAPAAFGERNTGFIIAVPASVPEAFKPQLHKRLLLSKHSSGFMYLEAVTDFFIELRERGIITHRNVDVAIAKLGTKKAEEEWRKTL